MKIIKICLTICLLMLGFINAAVAENLFITILEKGSGDPLEGATIVLGQTGEYNTTNKDGIAIFEDVNPVSQIKILNPGYETLEQKLKKNTKNITLYLYPLTVEGEALEVVEDRVQEKLSKIILTTEELKRIPGTAGDPLKVLTSLPGVVASSSQGGPGGFYVRGSDTPDNAVLINRIPVKYLFHFGDLLNISPSTINPSLVKDFNIFLGGFPVEYEDKLGGMLDVQLRNPKNDRIHQTYRVALHESAFLVEGPVQEKGDNDSFYVAGRMSYLDRVLTPEFLNKQINKSADEDEKDDFTILNIPRYYDAQANWHRDLTRGHFDLYFFAAGDSLAFNLNFTEDVDPELIGDLTFNYDYQSFGGNWLHRLNQKHTLMNTLSIRNFSEEQQIGTDKNTNEPFFVNVNTTTLSYDPQLSWRMNNKHELLFGSNISAIKSLVDIYVTARPTEDNTNQTFSSAPKYRIEDTINAIAAAPYIKHNWKITPKLKSSIGLRYSKVRATGGVSISGFSPRASLEYQLNKKALLFTSWGKYLQRPEGSTILRNFGNPRLHFMEAEHRIAGVEYTYSPAWKIKLEAYHKPLTKLVLVAPENAPPNNYQNAGKGEAYGIDFLLKREFSNRTMGWLSYSYAKSTRTTLQGQERDFSGDQPHTLNMVWSQAMPGSWKRWTWGTKLSIHSGALHTPITGRSGICIDNDNYIECTDQSDPESLGDGVFSHWEPKKGKQNSERLPIFYQMSLRIDRDIRFNSWKMNVFLDIQNLTFRKNIINYNYGKKYEKIENREAVAAFFLPIPLFGVEAEF